MSERNLGLEGAPNARTLDKITTAEGRKVKCGRIIRSGELSRLSDSDMQRLRDMQLAKIIDLRTDTERLQKPDRIPNAAEYIPCSVLPDKKAGISRDKPESFAEEAERTVSMARRLMPRHADGKEQMKALYPLLVSTEHAIESFRRFFDILLETESGAVLYHCTMGKDRVGTATALLLSALGVKRDEIVRDYMLTNENCAPGTKRLIDECSKICDDESVLQFVYDLDIVLPDYIGAAFDAMEKGWGSVEKYLETALLLDDEKINRLKSLYLD